MGITHKDSRVAEYEQFKPHRSYLAGQKRELTEAARPVSLEARMATNCCSLTKTNGRVRQLVSKILACQVFVLERTDLPLSGNSDDPEGLTN